MNKNPPSPTNEILTGRRPSDELGGFFIPNSVDSVPGPSSGTAEPGSLNGYVAILRPGSGAVPGIYIWFLSGHGNWIPGLAKPPPMNFNTENKGFRKWKENEHKKFINYCIELVIFL